MNIGNNTEYWPFEIKNCINIGHNNEYWSFRKPECESFGDKSKPSPPKLKVTSLVESESSRGVFFCS